MKLSGEVARYRDLSEAKRAFVALATYSDHYRCAEEGS